MPKAERWWSRPWRRRAGRKSERERDLDDFKERIAASHSAPTRRAGVDLRADKEKAVRGEEVWRGRYNGCLIN